MTHTIRALAVLCMLAVTACGDRTEKEATAGSSAGSQAAKEPERPSLTAQQRELLHRRGIEAAVWGMPLVSFDALRQAYFRDAGARYGDIVYWSRPSDAKLQIATPEAANCSLLFFVNLKDGPVTIEVPPAGGLGVSGSLIDSWNAPLADLGDGGDDHGSGGRYMLIGPGVNVIPPAGSIVVHATTNNVYALLRLVGESREKVDPSDAAAYIKRLRVQPVKPTPGDAPSRHIDMAGKPFNGLPTFDIGFFASLARMIEEEPVRPQDLAIMGQVHSLGIDHSRALEVEGDRSAVLMTAITEAHQYLVAGFRDAGNPWWPGKQWRSIASDDARASHGTFLLDDRVLIDDRAFTYFGACAIAHGQTANLYLKTHVDRDRHPLDGAKSYRLHVPANVPAGQFWSVDACDCQSGGALRDAVAVSIDSLMPSIVRNADGSVDVWFTPTAPPEHPHNWITTLPGQAFFVRFRIYGAKADVLDGSSALRLNDLQPEL